LVKIQQFILGEDLLGFKAEGLLVVRGLLEQVYLKAIYQRGEGVNFHKNQEGLAILFYGNYLPK
jgi:hypothetical protein